MKGQQVRVPLGIAVMMAAGVFLTAEASESGLRQVRYGFTVSNTTGDLLEKVSVFACAPVKETPTQRCVEIKTSHPYRLHADAHGNQILEFVLRRIPPYAAQVITMDANLEMFDAPRTVQVTNAQAYLEPTPLMPFDREEFLREMPPKLAFGSFGSVEEIFTWVQDRVRDVGYRPRDRGALYALAEGKGDCTEFSSLFTALCRRQAVPARRMAGVVTGKNQVISPVDLHNWSEFFENGVWLPADPQRNVFKTGGADYVALRVLEEGIQDPMSGLALLYTDHPRVKVEMNK